MRIIGIDPGSRATGYGVVDLEGQNLLHVAHGVIRVPSSLAQAARLAKIHRALAALVAEFEPQCAVIERVFLARNPKSAIVLGEARGAALAALAGSGLEVEEMSAREVKQAVTGNGGATKSDVQTMVSRRLGLVSVPPSDAADALAIAIGRSQAGRLAGLEIRRGRRRPRRLADIARELS